MKVASVAIIASDKDKSHKKVLSILRKTIIATCFILVALPAHAAGTWVLAAHGDQRKPTPGTFGEQYGLWGMGWYVDIKSIVKRGNRAYFNQSVVFLGEGKRPCESKSCGWDFTRGEPTRINSSIADCKTKQLIDATNQPLGKQGEITRQIANFACSN